MVMRWYNKVGIARDDNGMWSSDHWIDVSSIHLLRALLVEKLSAGGRIIHAFCADLVIKNRWLWYFKGSIGRVKISMRRYKAYTCGRESKPLLFPVDKAWCSYSLLHNKSIDGVL